MKQQYEEKEEKEITISDDSLLRSDSGMINRSIVRYFLNKKKSK